MSDPQPLVLNLDAPGIAEPVAKDTQALYVQASQDLQWLAENGALRTAARTLAGLRLLVSDMAEREEGQASDE